MSRACLTPGPARQRPVLTTARTPSPAPAPSRSLLEDRPRAAGLAEPDWHPDLGHPRETAPSEGPVRLRAAHLGGPVTMCSVRMAALSWGARGPHSRPRQAWRLQVGAQGACMALGCRCAKLHRKGSRVQSGARAGGGRAGSFRERCGSGAGSGWDPFCPARERALLPALSQTAQRAAPAPSPRPAAGGELPARPSTPCPLREERRALKWSLWAGPQAAAQALGAVPTLAGSTWAAGHAQPSAPSSPLRCGSPASVLGLLRFCDWSQALCQLLGPSSRASEAETVIGPISQTRL